MTPTTQSLNDDDIFLFSNIAAIAVAKGLGEQALPLLHMLQNERPSNAASFLLEAMHLYATQRLTEAIDLLETQGAFSAGSNRDEAIAFHLFLLQQSGQLDRTRSLGQTYLDEDLISSETARHTITTVLEEAHAQLATQRT